MSAPLLRHDWIGYLERLKPDWNGYGSPAISPHAILTLGSFAVVPCSDGGVQLEVHRDGFDIEIEIGADGRIESALVIANAPEKNR